MRHTFSLLALAGMLAGGLAVAAPDKMHAVEVGPEGSLSIQIRPVPQPKAGEVLVRVRAAGVNPVDWKSAQRRSGMVPGTDVSGTIDSVGEGVTGWKAGDPVLGFARESGSYAEYAVIPVASLARRPKTMSFEQAAGVPIAFETAYRSLHEAGKVQRGQTVLVHGAAGGVGSAAVQIAKAAGARVIGTASPNNHEFVKSLGADEVIDYTSVKFEDVVKSVDLVLNTVDGETNARSIGIVKPGGVLVSIVGSPDPQACAAAKILCTRPMRDKGASNAELLARIVELAEAGKLKVFVEQAFPMEQAAQAWEKNRGGHTRGKLVIRVAEGAAVKQP